MKKFVYSMFVVFIFTTSLAAADMPVLVCQPTKNPEVFECLAGEIWYICTVDKKDPSKLDCVIKKD